MDDLELVHRLLYYALIDIRDASRESNDKVSYHLADLFHNIPLQMGDAAIGGRTHSDVLESLRKRAEEKDCGRWLSDRLQQIHSRDAGQTGTTPGSKLAG